MFTKDDLKEQLRSMGIRHTDTVMIHTSMKAIGDVSNGADGVIDAFCDYLSDGLFLVPTHTWANVNANSPVYDVASTVPCIGALPRVAATRRDGVRSLHPTHSIWAHGKEAEDFIRNEENAETPCPVGFAWDRLADVGAKILLLGVGNNRNTFIHSVDERVDVPDRLSNEPFAVTIIDKNGNSLKRSMRPHRCSFTNDVSQYFVNFDVPFTKTGVQTFGKLGNATVRIVDAKKCREVLTRIYSRAEEDVCFGIKELPEKLYK